MPKIKYCPLCERNVPATKKFSWPLFIFLMFLGGAGFIYLILYFFLPANKCPICGSGGLMDQSTLAQMKQADKRMNE